MFTTTFSIVELTGRQLIRRMRCLLVESFLTIPFQSVQNGYSILLYPRYSITKSLYPEMGIDFFGQKKRNLKIAFLSLFDRFWWLLSIQKTKTAIRGCRIYTLSRVLATVLCIFRDFWKSVWSLGSQTLLVKEDLAERVGCAQDGAKLSEWIR